MEGEWISNIVGLKNVNAKYVSLELLEGQTKLELIKYFNPTSICETDIGLANKVGFRHMAFRVTNIEVAISKLKQLNVEFISDVQIYEPTNKKLVYFHGPDGILLELAQYG